jgi:hypothetical protein
MNKEHFVEELKQVCSAETSADPDGWSEKNPLWGHCAVVAVLAQDYFDGDILRGSLAEHTKYSYLRSHFWNQLPNGKEVDFTAEQYNDLSFSELKSELRERERILSHPGTQERYKLLKQRFNSK